MEWNSWLNAVKVAIMTEEMGMSSTSSVVTQNIAVLHQFPQDAAAVTALAGNDY